jgi:hypothetical protein
MTYEVYNVQDEMGPKAPDQKMIRVRLFTDRGWANAFFDKALAVEHATEMARLAETL